MVNLRSIIQSFPRLLSSSVCFSLHVNGNDRNPTHTLRHLELPALSGERATIYPVRASPASPARPPDFVSSEQFHTYLEVLFDHRLLLLNHVIRQRAEHHVGKVDRRDQERLVLVCPSLSRLARFQPLVLLSTTRDDTSQGASQGASQDAGQDACQIRRVY